MGIQSESRARSVSLLQLPICRTQFQIADVGFSVQGMLLYLIGDDPKKRPYSRASRALLSVSTGVYSGCCIYSALLLWMSSNKDNVVRTTMSFIKVYWCSFLESRSSACHFTFLPANSNFQNSVAWLFNYFCCSCLCIHYLIAISACRILSMASCLRTSYTISLANSKMVRLCVRLAKIVHFLQLFSIFVSLYVYWGECGLLLLSN